MHALGSMSSIHPIRVPVYKSTELNTSRYSSMVAGGVRTRRSLSIDGSTSSRIWRLVCVKLQKEFSKFELPYLLNLRSEWALYRMIQTLLASTKIHRSQRMFRTSSGSRRSVREALGQCRMGALREVRVMTLFCPQLMAEDSLLGAHSAPVIHSALCSSDILIISMALSTSLLKS